MAKMKFYHQDSNEFTCNYKANQVVNIGDELNIVLNAVNGYFSSFTPHLTYYLDGNQSVNMEKITDEQYTLNFIVPVIGATSSLTIKFYISNYVEFDEKNISHCSFSSNPEKIKLNNETTFTVKADEGYYFESPPNISLYDDIGEYYTYEFTTDDNINYTLVHTFTDLPQMLILNAVAQVKPKVDKYGIIQIYNPTSNELKEIGKKRFYTLDSNIIDLGAFIANLIRIYVKLPKENSSIVMLGGYNTNVECNTLLDDCVTTDCGYIEIIGIHENILDYENTTVEIYLPFIGIEKLDTDKVMNEKLHLIYKTNIINGDSLALIYNTNGVIIYTFSCNLSYKIPYAVNGNYSNSTSLEVNNSYLYGFTPFATIRTNKTYTVNNTISNDNRIAKVKDLHGYIECSNVFNTIVTTTKEKEMIDNVLKAGVIL